MIDILSSWNRTFSSHWCRRRRRSRITQTYAIADSNRPRVRNIRHRSAWARARVASLARGAPLGEFTTTEPRKVFVEILEIALGTLVRPMRQRFTFRAVLLADSRCHRQPASSERRGAAPA